MTGILTMIMVFTHYRYSDDDHGLCSLTGILTMIMVRTLRRDIAQYNKDDDLVSKASYTLRFICYV